MGQRKVKVGVRSIRITQTYAKRHTNWLNLYGEYSGDLSLLLLPLPLLQRVALGGRGYIGRDERRVKPGRANNLRRRQQ